MRLLSGLVLLLFSVLSAAATGGLLQFAAPPWQTYYYVNATTGNDSNNGTSAATPWLTLHKINNSVFAANSVIQLGGTFSGGDNGLIITTTVAPSGAITITSYGPALATISSGNSTACVTATNVPLVKVIGITCTGGGNTSNTTAGISIVNSQAGNTKLAGPTISGNTISGYGYNGISIQGTSGTSGFIGITITGNTVHDVTGNSTNSFGTCGIFVFSATGYGSGATTPSHTNVSVTGNTVYNATGNSSASANWSGCGIFVSQSSNVTIGGSPSGTNVAHDFGGSNGSAFEPVGVWLADDLNATASYNEVYNGLAGTNAAPAQADGTAIDGGCVNCLVEKNKVHDNAGVGVLLENYNDGTCCALFSNNTVRYNLLQNNAQSSTAGAVNASVGFNFVANASGTSYVYGNTIVNQNGFNAFGDLASSTSTTTIDVWNNIIAVNNGGKLINLTNTTGISFAGNDYYTYGAAFTISWGGSSYTSFAAWQTATSQEKISGSNVGLTGNPQIYVPGGLFITAGYAPTQDMADNLQTGSPMIGAGVNIQSQFGINPGATDYYGVAISAASLPVGAANGDFGTFAASCTDATNFLARTSSFAKLDNVNYNSLLCGENSDGDLTNVDVQYMPAAPNSAASLLNLVSTSYSLTPHGTTTFTARVGIAGNGSTGYLDTGWVPSTNGVNYTETSVTHLGYSLTNGQTDAQALYGVQNSAATSETSNFPGTGGWYSDANDFTGLDTTGTTNSNGLFLMNRTGNTLTQYLNGTSVHTASVAPIATPNQNMILLGFNVGTGSGIVANQFSTATEAAVLFGGGGVSPANISRRISSFMQAYGINVY